VLLGRWFLVILLKPWRSSEVWTCQLYTSGGGFLYQVCPFHSVASPVYSNWDG
jgi:hypothetical protein